MNSPLIKEHPDVSKVSAALDRENWVFSLSDTQCAGVLGVFSRDIVIQRESTQEVLFKIFSDIY